MSIEDRYRAAMEAHKAAFGRVPSLQWLDEDCDGDEERFIAMVEKAVRDKKPIPLWEQAHGIPPGAKT